MRRTTNMTLGFVLILIGIQLNLVQSYELTPRFSNFLSANGNAVVNAPVPVIAQSNQQYNSPYYQASFPNVTTQPAVNLPSGQIKIIDVPNWLCWPVLFLGAVVFLNGLAKRE